MKSYLIENARIFDGSGSPCFPGSVRVEGERIAMVAAGEQPLPRESAEVIDAGGRVLMPGLVDAHTHLAFPSSIERLVPSFGLPPEESLLISARHARILLDHGFTSAYSAGTLAPRLDIVIRDEIKAGRLPGPRLRACAVEQFPASMAALFHADPSTNDLGPDGVRRYVKSAAATGVDVVKFCLSGENQLSPGSSHEVCYSDEEVLAAGEQARESGIWLSAHAQSSKPIQQALKAGFRVIYHCTFADEETLDLMEQSREQIFVAPAVGVLQGTINPGRCPACRSTGCRATRKTTLNCCPIWSPASDRAKFAFSPEETTGLFGIRPAATRATSSISLSFSATRPPTLSSRRPNWAAKLWAWVTNSD